MAKGNDVSAPSGYLTPEGKNIFILITAAGGVIFFLIHLIFPFAALIYLFYSEGLSGGYSTLESAVLWKKRIWFVKNSFNKNSRETYELWSLKPFEKEEPKKEASIKYQKPMLLADKDKLWVISEENVGQFDGTQIILLASGQRLLNYSHPFIYHGRPAVIEDNPDGQQLSIFDDQGWKKEIPFHIALVRGDYPLRENLQIITAPDKVYLFLKYGEWLYFSDGIPEEGGNWLGWQPVSKANMGWGAFLINNTPEIFVSGDKEDRYLGITGLKLKEYTWEEFFSDKKASAYNFQVFHLDDSDESLIFSYLAGRINILKISGNHMAGEISYGKESNFPYEPPMNSVLLLGLLLIIASFLPAIILSILMGKYRLAKYTTGGRTVSFASLGKRGLAELMDSLIGSIPIIVLSLENLKQKSVFSSFFTVSGLLPIIAWMILCLLVFSYFEGKWGATPGKLLCSIRVLGKDLKYCGFIRAFIRNVLEIIDGIFCYLVGILFVAFTENWQRLGDLAARTIVVTSKSLASNPTAPAEENNEVPAPDSPESQEAPESPEV